MRKLIILLILSVIRLNTFAQVEFPGGPGGELDVDIYPVKKQGFKSFYMGQGIIAMDIMILSKGYDLRLTPKFETTIRPIEIAISAPANFTTNSYSYTIPKINNFLKTNFDKVTRHLNTNYFFYKIEVPLFKLTGIVESASNSLTITIDPKGLYTIEHLAKLTNNNYVGYIYEASKKRRNNVVNLPAINQIILLNPAPVLIKK